MKKKLVAVALAVGTAASVQAADLSAFTTAIGTEAGDIVSAVALTMASGLGIGAVYIGGKVAWKGFKAFFG